MDNRPEYEIWLLITGVLALWLALTNRLGPLISVLSVNVTPQQMTTTIIALIVLVITLQLLERYSSNMADLYVLIVLLGVAFAYKSGIQAFTSTLLNP